MLSEVLLSLRCLENKTDSAQEALRRACAKGALWRGVSQFRVVFRGFQKCFGYFDGVSLQCSVQSIGDLLAIFWHS